MTDEIRYRPDGSIDIGYYMQIGRRMRAEQAIKLLAGCTRRNRRKRRRLRNIFAFV
ncbi:MAG: hypothetical protein K8F31_09575 [Roseovarius sp.]|nr:hypothetical protein [Roseovarius sp.]